MGGDDEKKNKQGVNVRHVVIGTLAFLTVTALVTQERQYRRRLEHEHQVEKGVCEAQARDARFTPCATGPPPAGTAQLALHYTSGRAPPYDRRPDAPYTGLLSVADGPGRLGRGSVALRPSGAAPVPAVHTARSPSLGKGVGPLSSCSPAVAARLPPCSARCGAAL